MKHLYVILLFGISLLPFTGWSQDILLPFNFNNNPSTGQPTVGNESSFQTLLGNSVYPSTITRGSGVTVGATLASGFAGSGWTDNSLNAAVQGNRYYTFDIANDADLRMSIQALDCYLYRSATGPVWYQWEYSLDAFSTPGIRLGDSVNFTGFDPNGIKQPELITRTISDLLYVPGAVTFRLYAWGSSDPDGVFAFGKPAADNSIAVLGRMVQRFQEYELGNLNAFNGYITSQGRPSAPQTLFLVFGDISDTITITMPDGFELSADSVHWTNIFKFDPLSGTYTSGQSVYVRISSLAPAGFLHRTVILRTPGLADVSQQLYGTVYPAPDTLLYANNFNVCDGYTPGPATGGFTEYNVTGTQPWTCSLYGRDPTMLSGVAVAHGNGVQITTGSAGNPALNEAWLISPRFDLSAAKFPMLNFWSRSPYADVNFGGPLQLKVSTDYTGTGSPALAHWTTLNGHFPVINSNIWTLSSNINLSGYKQDGVYIAFVYASAHEDGTTWIIDDLSLIDASTAPPTLSCSSDNLEFGYAAAGTTVDKKLTITTNDLVSDITVTVAGSNFLISTDSINFSNTVTIGHDTANNNTEPLFVRFAPAADNIQYFDSLQVSVPDTTVLVRLRGNSIDSTSTINMVSWNLDYFGTSQTNVGPADKTVQVANVKTILPTMHADVYALQEVVSEPALADIVASMPGYAYSISSYGSHSNPSDPAHADLGTVQKLAFVYNTAKVKDVQTDSLLTTGVNQAADVTTRYYADWAGGRYPYMLTANVTLNDRNGGTIVKKIHFINIHAIADTGNVIAAYDHRRNASFALDSLVKKNYNTESVVILGDFNDDLAHTITTGRDTTSYSAFTYDSLLYQFPTRVLSQQQQYTDVNKTGEIGRAHV